MTLNTKKVNTNQNLIPQKMVYKYLYQKTVIPAISIIVAIFLICAVGYYSSISLTENYIEKTGELQAQDLTEQNKYNKEMLAEKEQERDDLQNKYNNYYNDNPFNVNIDESILNRLQTDLNRLQAELDELLAEDGKDDVVTVQKKYKINELMNFIDQIRSNNVIVISLEDIKTETSTSSEPLVWTSDIGLTTFSLHGMATSSTELSKFILALDNCEYVADTHIVSVETQIMDDGTNVYAFEVGISPKVFYEQTGGN